MRVGLLTTWVVAAGGVVAAGDAPPVKAEKDQGFTTLFDGKDLAAWKMSPEAHWVVEDGVIALNDRTDGKLNNADYLWTKETYGDFILELEFKVCEGYANSGVFLRTADLGRPGLYGHGGPGEQLPRPRAAQPRRHGRGDLRLPGPHGEPRQAARPVEPVPDHLPRQPDHGRAQRQEDARDGPGPLDRDRQEPGRHAEQVPQAARGVRPRTATLACRTTAGPVWYRNIRIKRLP